MFQSSPPAGAAPLQTLQRIPQDKPLPVAPLVLQKTTKALAPPPLETVKTAAIPSAVAPAAPVSVQTKPPEGINAPVLEKVVKALSTTPRPTGPAALRPTWPDHTQNAPIIAVPQTVPSRIEDPRGMYMVNCEIMTLGPNADSPAKSSSVIHGLFSFDRVMNMPGKDVTDKLINWTLTKILPESLPPFLKMGVGMGTANMKVSYPVAGGNPDLVATIEINSSDEKRKYRTVTIRRFKPDVITALEL